MRNILKIKTLSCLLVLTTGLSAQSAHRQLRRGEELYDDQKYAASQQAYEEAATDPAAAFNAGNAAYQQGKYADAASLYKKAAAIAPNGGVKSDALYNLGNAMLQSGKLEEAVTAYETSLRLNANRADAKKNLQIAKNKLREQQEPPPPPPQKTPPPPPPPPRRNYVDRAQEPQKKESFSGTMTAENARQLLDATIELEEQKNARQYRALPPEARPSRTKKDW